MKKQIDIADHMVVPLKLLSVKTEQSFKKWIEGLLVSEYDSANNGTELARKIMNDPDQKEREIMHYLIDTHRYLSTECAKNEPYYCNGVEFLEHIRDCVNHLLVNRYMIEDNK